MEKFNWPDLIQWLFSLVALVLAISKHPGEKQKTSAETMESTGNAAESFANAASKAAELSIDYQKKVIALEKRADEHDAEQTALKNRTHFLELVLERCAKRIAYLMGGIAALIKQVKSLNAQPVWTPDEWDLYDLNHGKEEKGKG